MMTYLSILMFLVCYTTASSLNPVKTGVSILMLSSLVFTFMFMEKGVTWFPWVFLMLFMGGILIIFLILSSISPNEKTKKMKYSDWVIMGILVLTGVLLTPMNGGSAQVFPQLKWFYQMSSSLILVTILIALYFFMFVAMLTEDKASMRANQC